MDSKVRFASPFGSEGTIRYSYMINKKSERHRNKENGEGVQCRNLVRYLITKNNGVIFVV